MKKGFTMVELVIVISLIAIISAIIVPQIKKGYENSKENITNIYNGSKIMVIDVDTKEVIYEGTKENLDGYVLVDVQYDDSYVVMYVRKK